MFKNSSKALKAIYLLNINSFPELFSREIVPIHIYISTIWECLFFPTFIKRACEQTFDIYQITKNCVMV